jgi:hypothetical protein
MSINKQTKRKQRLLKWLIIEIEATELYEKIFGDISFGNTASIGFSFQSYLRQG